MPGLAVADHGDVGAEDLGAGTFTFFPSVMVDCFKNMAIGFSASNSSIFGGAYYASRFSIAPPGTIGPTCTLAAGTAPYVRTYCTGRNRWGDYSGLALCPVDEATFYVYNEYACDTGTPTGGCAGAPCPTLPLPGFEDGRWCTRLGCFVLKETVSVAILSFDATVSGGGVELRSSFASDLDIAGVNVYRADGDSRPVLREHVRSNPRAERFSYLDANVEPGQRYRYQLGIVDADGEVLSQVIEVTAAGGKFAFYEPAPNPFNPSTVISFVLPSSERVQLAVYDASGQLVKTLVNEVRSPGRHEVEWNGTDAGGRNVSSGVYLYRITAGENRHAGKLVLLK